MHIPFHKPSFTDLEIGRIGAAAASRHLRAGGPYSRLCLELLSNRFGESELLLTGSATAALEMAMILAGIEPGDEVIMPAFTFVSCANSVVLRGGTPVFVDIRPDTLNIDIEPHATRSRIGPVPYSPSTMPACLMTLPHCRAWRASEICW